MENDINIFVVFTVHTELGKCNSKALYNIIEILKPEIIFEEISDYLYNQCYNEQNFTKLLEQNAIKEYIRKYPIPHIPVDTLEIPNSYYEECEAKLRLIRNNNFEYIKLLNTQSLFVIQNGFYYLNSDYSNTFLERIRLLEKKIIYNRRFYVCIFLHLCNYPSKNTYLKMTTIGGRNM